MPTLLTLKPAPSSRITQTKIFLLVAVNPREDLRAVPYETETRGDPALVAVAIAEAMAEDKEFRLLILRAIHTFSTIKTQNLNDEQSTNDY